MGSPEKVKKTGRRSEAFDFLLNKEFAPAIPKSRYSVKRDNYEQYVNDLTGGDKEIQKELKAQRSNANKSSKSTSLMSKQTTLS